MNMNIEFQSTPPVWVVTFVMFDVIATGKLISIHTTRVGGDIEVSAEKESPYKFQSTPPVWVVTVVSL